MVSPGSSTLCMGLLIDGLQETAPIQSCKITYSSEYHAVHSEMIDNMVPDSYLITHRHSISTIPVKSNNIEPHDFRFDALCAGLDS